MIDPAPLVALAKRLAPELADVPVYILSMDELEGVPLPREAHGFADTSGIMGAAYISRLGDRYVGPGPLIGLDDQYILERSKPGKFRTCLVATLIHELGHILPHRPIEDAPRTERAVQVHTEALERHYSAPPQVATEDPFHDWRWIRRCAHLFTRAAAVPVEVYPSDILGYEHRLSPLNHYLPLLAAECDRLRDATFDQIESTPPPPACENTSPPI